MIELKTFRDALESKQSELGIANREALAVETSADELDRIQNLGEREHAMNHMELKSNRLREVRAALRRMDEGTYGMCSNCEEIINRKRLVAMPWASSCIGCQEAAERALAESKFERDLTDAFA